MSSPLPSAVKRLFLACIIAGVICWLCLSLGMQAGATFFFGTQKQVKKFPPQVLSIREDQNVKSEKISGEKNVSIRIDEAKSAEQIQREKISKLTDLVRHLKNYEKLWQSLFGQVPYLKDIQSKILQWQRYFPDEKYPEEQKKWQFLVASNPKLGKVLFKLMYLQRPAVLSSMAKDNDLQILMAEIYEVAGEKANVRSDFAVLDSYAGIESGSGNIPTTYSEYELFLENKAAEYMQASVKLIEKYSLSMQIDASMYEYMREQMKKELMVDYLKMYHDTYFTSEIEASSQVIRKLEAVFNSYPSYVAVPQNLLNEYQQTRSLYSLTTLSDAPLAEHKNK